MGWALKTLVIKNYYLDWKKVSAYLHFDKDRGNN